jgi:hypothetical protein
MINQNLNAALKYLNTYHFSVIPCKKDKKPFIPWEEFQKRLPTETEIKDWWQKYPDAQVGIVTGIISGLYVVDLDNPEAEEVFKEIVPDSLLMPTVTTPRGGKHHYFKCTDSNLTNKAMLLGKKMDFRGNGGYVLAPPSTNGKGNAYTFLSGLSIKDIALPYLPNNIISILSSSLKQQELCQPNKSVTSNYKMLPLLQEGARDNDLFHIANCMIKGGLKDIEVSQLLNILAKNCNPPFPEKEAMEKVKSALGRAERRERNITQEVREWILVTSSDFRVTELYNELQVVTKEQKGAVRVCLTRMVQDGFLERIKKIGCYRVVNTTADKIDFLSIEDETIDVRWPFEIESLVKTMPKNIIIVAGVSNSGKTAFLLNFIEKNMQDYEIHYFSSEMGNMELRTRLSKFDRPIDSWKFIPYERAGEFADVIKPDAINIIDFLEIYQEHYLIGQWIKDIYDKLNKGIAIIAIQKKPGASVGVGGVTTLEKARLYLNMDSGKLKIEKGKNWANELVNPNNMYVEFKLVQGCKFIQSDDWKREERK